jgi:hypothetical protein
MLLSLGKFSMHGGQKIRSTSPRTRYNCTLEALTAAEKGSENIGSWFLLHFTYEFAIAFATKLLYKAINLILIERQKINLV